mmetsp:Transcript_18073/g.51289  ORF Transcript_18073/g.51289 Transcript_18073/m.51289 type:complete len:520 (+) Transcript_18073:278-1837(+)
MLAMRLCGSRLLRHALADEVRGGAVRLVAAELKYGHAVLVLLLPSPSAGQAVAVAVLAARLLLHVVSEDLAGRPVCRWADELDVVHDRAAALWLRRGHHWGSSPCGSEAGVASQRRGCLDASRPVPNLALAPFNRVVNALALGLGGLRRQHLQGVRVTVRKSEVPDRRVSALAHREVVVAVGAKADGLALSLVLAVHGTCAAGEAALRRRALRPRPHEQLAVGAQHDEGAAWGDVRAGHPGDWHVADVREGQGGRLRRQVHPVHVATPPASVVVLAIPLGDDVNPAQSALPLSGRPLVDKHGLAVVRSVWVPDIEALGAHVDVRVAVPAGRDIRLQEAVDLDDRAAPAIVAGVRDIDIAAAVNRTGTHGNVLPIVGVRSVHPQASLVRAVLVDGIQPLPVAGIVVDPIEAGVPPAGRQARALVDLGGGHPSEGVALHRPWALPGFGRPGLAATALGHALPQGGHAREQGEVGCALVARVRSAAAPAIAAVGWHQGRASARALLLEGHSRLQCQPRTALQ